MKRYFFLIFILIIVSFTGCATGRNYFQPESAPLREYTLQGTGTNKVLVIPVFGFISDHREQSFLRSQPSLVQELVSHLSKAEQDRNVKAVVLKIDSPGGTVTASDILYNEIRSFKERTGAKVVVSVMNMAASGGYYISLPADHIAAHPTSIIGSIGVLYIQPKVNGLMEKVGVDFEVSKSGEMKDMGSPLRPSTEEEKQLMQDLTETLGQRFLDLVMEHRKLNKQQLDNIATGRVYIADEALQTGLIDSVSYLEDAIEKAKNLAELPESAKVIVYRRSKYPDDNLYNTATMQQAEGLPIVNLELPDSISQLRTGFYYLWAPGLD
jgi:protease-4